MKTKTRLILCAGLVLLLNCCSSPSKNGSSKQDAENTSNSRSASTTDTPLGATEAAAVNRPASRGLPYELVLIIPRAAYTGELKDSLEAVLLGSTPLLPQHEPMFRLDVAYTDGNLTPWRTMRNRLVVDIDRSLTRSQLQIAYDPVARPQVEIRLTAPSPHDLALYLGTHRTRITDLFVNHELNYEASCLRRKHDRMTYDSLRALCGHTICVPSSFRASKRGIDFLWTGTNLNDKDQNFVYYSYPWNGQPLSMQQFVAKHDSILQANIPGSRPDQWMQTATASSTNASSTPTEKRPLVIARTRTINNIKVLQVHGLWEMRNGALGGPFVALERVDSAAHRVIVTEAFVYSPHSPKRDIMRQMEAALWTFK